MSRQHARLSVSAQTVARLAFTILLSFAAAAVSLADYYTYTDEQGNVHYTDNPSALPDKVLKRAKRVEVDMGPEKAVESPSVRTATETPDVNMKKPAAKSPRKILRASEPPAYSAASESSTRPPERATATNAGFEEPDPALSTPLKTIRHFRRSLASGDYASAAKCLHTYDARGVQAFLSQLPRELVTMLSEEFSPAVEIVRTDDQAVYMIGDPRKSGTKLMKRYDVTLVRIGNNWKITH